MNNVFLSLIFVLFILYLALLLKYIELRRYFKSSCMFEKRIFFEAFRQGFLFGIIKEITNTTLKDKTEESWDDFYNKHFL